MSSNCHIRDMVKKHKVSPREFWAYIAIVLPNSQSTAGPSLKLRASSSSSGKGNFEETCHHF